MGKKKYSLVMFSRELARDTSENQARAIKSLWDFVAHKKNIKPKGREHKLADEFALHFTGEIELYRQYADADKILFQPEVFRGFLSPQERQRIRSMKFNVEKLSR